jgi:hypothetical protein
LSIAIQVPQTEIVLRQEGKELLRVIVAPGEYVIGSGAEAEVRVETLLLSPRHTRLTVNYDHWLIEDLGSASGTFVAERTIAEATRLFPNQSVRLGEVKLELRRLRQEVDAEASLAPAEAAIRRHLPEELLSSRRYGVGAEVARGGMSAILQARQMAVQRTVAMKVMLQSPDDVLRFIEEAQVTAQLEHPTSCQCTSSPSMSRASSFTR